MGKWRGFLAFSTFCACVEAFFAHPRACACVYAIFTPIYPFIGVKRARVLCACMRGCVRNVYIYRGYALFIYIGRACV